jgi:transcriptional regulator with XRE-family HTH domain
MSDIPTCRVKSNVEESDPWAGTVGHVQDMDTVDPSLGYGPKLKALRIERGLKQGDVAEAIGVARPTLSGIENEKDAAGRATLVAAADFYRVSLDWLISAPGSPGRSDTVDDPDELALLDMWREFDDGERGLALRILKGFGKPNGS